MKWDILESTGSVVRDWDVEEDVEPSDYPEYLSPLPESAPAWMPYTRRMSRSYRRKGYKRSRRGKYSRRAGRRSLKALVARVLMKRAETKYYDRALENHQLYHNLGSNVGGLVPVNITAIPQFFNPWAFISKGTNRFERIGDKITPRGMSLKLYLANKNDRPNTMIRIIVAILPKQVNGTITTAVFDPFQTANSGTNGNNMLWQADSNIGVKFLYDKVHRMPTQQWAGGNAGGGTNREFTKLVKLWIKRKRSRDIVYGDTALDIVNKPLAIYAIPYEQYSTLTTDNIASLAGVMRLYYKDV